jgi:iron complex outermembrane recepter protein
MNNPSLLRLTRCFAYAAAGALATLAAPYVHAWEAADAGLGLEEIIVTAEKRPENAQTVPISISVIGPAVLQEGAVVRITDFAGLIPNLYINSNDSLRATDISIRGIVSDPNNIDVEPSVGVYLDGVYLARPTTINAGLFDLERVEVLRGPQGTIFGKNTIAGAIDFVSKLPTQQQELDVTAQYGNYNDRLLQVIANTPLVTDVLAIRGAFQFERRDGFLTNLAGPDNDDANNINGRISLAYTPTDAFSAVLRVDGSRDRTHDEASVIFVPSPLFSGPPFNVPQEVSSNPFDRVIRESPSPFENRDVLGASFETNWKVAGGTLTSLIAFRHFRWSNYSSEDASDFDIFGTGILENEYQNSEELRFASNPNAPLTYVTGVYVDQQGENATAYAHVGTDVFAPFGAPLDSNPTPGEGYIQLHTHDRSYAAFGQADYHFNSKWVLTGGYRYTQQFKLINQFLVADPTGQFVPNIAPATYSRTDIQPSYNASLKYLFTEGSMGYLTYSHGFKAGGFNAFSFGLTQANGQIAEFAPEHINNYELGIKTTFDDGRVRLNADIFYMDYRDLQVSQNVQNNTGVIDYVTSNAAKARSEGLELELEARLTSELEAGLGYGYADAIYTSYPGALPPTSTLPLGANFTGNTLPESPKSSISSSLDYTHHMSEAWNLIGRSEFVYRSSRFSDPDNTPALVAPEYSIVNLRAGAATADGALRVELWARNLFNRDYVIIRGYGSSAFSPGAIYESIGDPRTYGVSFTYKWLAH